MPALSLGRREESDAGYAELGGSFDARLLLAGQA
jgi:hypothetical protein